MTCASCGAPNAIPGGFCSHCGVKQPIMAAPQQMPYTGQPMYAVPYVPRVQKHLQTLGILWGIYGVYRFGAGVIGLFFASTFHMAGFSAGFPFSHHHMSGHPMFLAFLPFLLGMMGIFAALELITAYGLLNRKSWARTLAIVLSVFALFSFPFGTVLGIFTLWVLAPAASGAEFDAISQP